MHREIKAYEKLLRSRLRDKRYEHSLSVRDEAVRLAKIFGADIEKARIAGLLHDITKEEDAEGQLRLLEKFGITLEEDEKQIPKIWHSITGAAFLEKELGIHDEEILNAVRYHTTGRAGMTLLEKIIYLADCIEPTRDYPGVKGIRLALKSGVDDAMILALSGTMRALLNLNRVISRDSFEARNDLLLKK